MKAIEKIKETHHLEFLNSNTDFEVRSLDTMCVNESELKHPFWHNLKYLAAGILFGIILFSYVSTGGIFSNKYHIASRHLFFNFINKSNLFRFFQIF